MKADVIRVLMHFEGKTSQICSRVAHGIEERTSSWKDAVAISVLPPKPQPVPAPSTFLSQIEKVKLVF